VTTFADLGLSPDILKAIEDRGYTTPTPIQEQAIPHVLMMRDLLGCAQTGTGKTAGFTLPMIEILANGRARARMPRSLILEPTRELATQVAESFRIYGKYHKLNMALLIGGENMEPQIRELDRGVDVLIATPGRLLDLFERGRILLSDIKIFVIDEADRMLDMGFMPDVEKIAGLLPPLKQTLFFSATMPPEMRTLADRFLKNPRTVSVTPSASTAENITQILIDLPSDSDWQKREALRLLLKRESVQNAFIFCNRKKDVALLNKSLQRHGFNVGALHGDMDQSSRTATLDSFRNGTITFLACSDVAARGLDVPDVSHVFNFDVPFHAEDYVHRIGRTGRAGKAGTSYTLVTPEEAKQVAAIEHLIKMQIPRETLPDLPAVQAQRLSHKKPAGQRRDRKRPPRDGKTLPRRAKQLHHEPPHQESHAPVSSPKTSAPKKETGSHKPGSPVGTHGFGDNLPAFLRRPPARRTRSG
jgi:superfamily II DNA/RNA helicase